MFNTFDIVEEKKYVRCSGIGFNIPGLVLLLEIDVTEFSCSAAHFVNDKSAILFGKKNYPAFWRYRVSGSEKNNVLPCQNI